MMMIEDQEHLDKVREFARSVGAEAALQKQLDFLAGFGEAVLRARGFSEAEVAALAREGVLEAPQIGHLAQLRCGG
jgi:hypothetical protein